MRICAFLVPNAPPTSGGVSKTELLEHLLDYNWEKFSNVIEVYISGLRRKLNDGASRQLIRTLRGQVCKTDQCGVTPFSGGLSRQSCYHRRYLTPWLQVFSHLLAIAGDSGCREYAGSRHDVAAVLVPYAEEATGNVSFNNACCPSRSIQSIRASFKSAWADRTGLLARSEDQPKDPCYRARINIGISPGRVFPITHCGLRTSRYSTGKRVVHFVRKP